MNGFVVSRESGERATSRSHSHTVHSPEGHVVQFYEDDAFLCDLVSDFVMSGLAAEEPLVLIASSAHTGPLVERLRAAGVDVDAARADGRLTLLDASRTLASFMVDGMPDAERFKAAIGPVLQKAASRGCHVRVRAYGEMVDLLCRDGKPNAAIRLEQLWNGLRQSHSFSLLCAYGMSTFRDEALAGKFHQICQAHSQVLPTESYSQLEDSEQRLREVSLLQQRAQALENEIAHRREAERALREAVRAREEFLSIAGHELKTPLTVLALRTELLCREAQGEADSDFVRKVREHAEASARQIQRLTSLVNELLDVSRIATGGRFALELDEMDLTGVVRDVATRFHAPAARAGSTIEIEASAPVFARTDRLRVEQAITNLVDNAIKYGLGKPIRVSCGADADRALISVSDQGIGIDPLDHGRIFDRFERAVSDRSYGGLGLGLFITRAVAAALGGSVRVESAPGRGARFTLALPLVYV